jgi:hypothetical protein
MAFTWPARTTYNVKEKVSQVLWVLKQEGDIEDKRCAVRVLQERLKAHGVEITAEHGFRLMLVEMEGGRYGDLILRKINGRRTQGLYLITDEMPPNYLPDAELDLDDDDVPANAGETFTRQALFAVPAVEAPASAETKAPEPTPVPAVASRPVPPAPVSAPAPVSVPVRVAPAAVAVAPVPVVPAAVSAPAAAVDRQFDRIAAELESELDDLRKPMASYPRVTIRERVGQDRNLNDKAGVLSAILELVGDLAVMVAGDPTKEDADTEVLDRLADAIERAERFRKRALNVEETAVARKAEADGLRRQLADKEAQIARMEANIEAMQNGERVPNEGMVRAGQKFLTERPHHRRGANEDSTLVYSTGG